MSDKVLAAVGRRHTARQTIEAFYRGDAAPAFDDINMDLIAGLPDDDEEGFADSIRQVLALGPSNITVHTLALKKGAALFSSRAPLPPQEAVAAMLAGAEDALRDNGYEPYYLYRQKYMSGSFENTGWCRPGYTGLLQHLHDGGAAHHPLSRRRRDEQDQSPCGDARPIPQPQDPAGLYFPHRHDPAAEGRDLLPAASDPRTEPVRRASMDTLFSHVNIVTMNEQMTLWSDAFVGVTDGKIAYMAKKPPAGAAEEDH
ncbi:MAG: hypothetical protein ACLU3F_15370 [Blautia wexlerae]